jgi:TrmH family RNA methyltransferase
VKTSLPPSPFAAPGLDGIRVILNRPKDPGNVGSVARAMANFGLSDLAVVGGLDTNVPDARRMAMGGGRSVLFAAQRFSTIREAAAQHRWVIGTTPRAHETWTLTTPRERAAEWVARAREGGVAIVFGNEVRGLSNLHLSRCNEIAAIPTLGMQSLNLAQAALVFFYEIAQAAGAPACLPRVERIAATHEEMEGFYTHLQATLLRAKYLFPSNPEHIMDTLRHIMRRADPGQRDVAILRGILRKLDRILPP